MTTVSAAVAVVAGVAWGVVGDVTVAGCLAAAAGLAGAGLVWPRRGWPVVVLACAAAGWGSHAREVRLAGLPLEWRADDPVVVRGVLLSDAVVVPGGVRLDILAQGRRIRASVTGSLAVEAAPQWLRGRTLTAPMRLRQPEVRRNPGGPSPRWQRLTRRHDAIASVKSGALVQVTPGHPGVEWAARIRQHVRSTITRRTTDAPAVTAGIVTAILIGDRADLDDALARQLQAAGVFHVIAISGGNIALLTVAVLWLIRRLTRALRWPPLATAAIVLVYGGIVGPDPSVTRAVTAATAYLVVRACGLTPAPVSLFAVVALTLAAADPMGVVDVGAWLSFGATWGLLVVLPRLQRAALPEGRPLVWRWIASAVLATVAAELVVLPISAAVFHRVGVAGLALNLVAVPSMVLIQAGGLWAAVAEPAGAGAPGIWAATLGVRGLLWTAAAVEWAPWLSWRVPGPPLVLVVCYAAALGAALRVRRPDCRGVMTAAVVALLLTFGSAPWVAADRPSPGWLRVTVLDVGQGDSTLVQSPDGHAMLIDAGGSPSGGYDVGARIVSPALWALGVRRLDAVVLTHGDLDHVGGAGSVLDDFRPHEVWEGIPVDEDLTLQSLRARAHDRRLAWRRVTRGHEVEWGGVTVHVRHPPPAEWQRVRVRNDDSVVIEVILGGVSVLVTGDAGAEFEAAPWPTPRTGAPPRLRVLRVGHHGSRTSTSEAWLGRFRPHVAIVSAGAGNLFGHPAPVVLDRLAGRGAALFRTDHHGAVVIETDGAQLRVRGVAGGRWDAR